MLVRLLAVKKQSCELWLCSFTFLLNAVGETLALEKCEAFNSPQYCKKLTSPTFHIQLYRNDNVGASTKILRFLLWRSGSEIDKSIHTEIYVCWVYLMCEIHPKFQICISIRFWDMVITRNCSVTIKQTNTLNNGHKTLCVVISPYKWPLYQISSP